MADHLKDNRENVYDFKQSRIVCLNFTDISRATQTYIVKKGQGLCVNTQYSLFFLKITIFHCVQLLFTVDNQQFNTVPGLTFISSA